MISTKQSIISVKSKIFALGEWSNCRGLAVAARSGVSTLGFKFHSYQILSNLRIEYCELLITFNNLVHRPRDVIKNKFVVLML